MKQKNNFDNPIIVMKFGGTSLRSEESRSHAIKHISRHYKLGKKILVVVSAMGRKGEPYATDTLISLMKSIGEPVNPTELDSIISIGETLSSILFSHLLNKNDLPAESFSGSKTGILTDNNPGNAEILKIDTAKLKITLNQGKIAVVAGFQGTTSEGEVRTLGRGGSDTSAVALGSALNAEFVEIYSDVDGIANCDPNQIPEASFIEKVSIKQILSMANEGSKVLHPRAVRASMKNKTTIVVRNTFSNAKGTTIHHSIPPKKNEQVILAHRENMTMLEISSKKNLKTTFPEMILIDKKRCLLKNDIYLESRINELQTLHGKIFIENGWTTISVIFEKKIRESLNIPNTEIISCRENIICYILKENNLSTSLRKLFNHYNKMK